MKFQTKSAVLATISVPAQMTLTFGGDMDRLANELAYKGVQIKTDPKIGIYLARSNFRL